MRNREILENHLQRNIDIVKHNRRDIEAIKMELMKNKIKPGEAQRIISSVTPLSELDARILCLLDIHLHNITRDELIHPEIYFQPVEIEKAKTYQEWEPENLITLPYTFHNVEQYDYDDYEFPSNAQELKQFYDSKLIDYEFETQREAKIRVYKKKIIQEPKVNKASVNNIANLMEKDELIRSTITLNIPVDPFDTEPPLVYNEKERTLTVYKKFNILDGFHRSQGLLQCLNTNPDKNMKFTLQIVHFDVEKAQKWFNQKNTINPVSQSRLQETNLNKFSSGIILDKLQKGKDSLLNGRISSSMFTHSEALVTANVLTSAIDEFFEIKDMLEARQYADYLVEFFNQLVMINPDAFMKNIKDVRKESVINTNSMFYGYTLLAKRFREENIPVVKLKNVIESIDFSRSNQLWKELGVLNEDERISTRARNKIKQYFNNLSLTEAAV